MWLAALLGLALACRVSAQSHGFIGFAPDSDTPGPSGENFYLNVFMNDGITAQAPFVAKFFSGTTQSQRYYKTVPTQVYFPTNSYINWCNWQWGIPDPQVSYRDKTYGFTEDPRAGASGLFPFTNNLFSIKRVRACGQGMECPGCYLNNAPLTLGFIVTSDDETRTVFTYGVCRGWIQIECTSMTTCGNGYYSNNFLAKDPITLLTLYPITCMPCEPGTWNTCLTPKTSCSW